jgi:hypothetical protein
MVLRELLLELEALEAREVEQITIHLRERLAARGHPAL